MATRRNYQRKKNGYDSPLHVLPVVADLIDYTLNLTDNAKHFPKKVRFTIVNRIQERVLSIYEKRTKYSRSGTNQTRPKG
jgi:hypothetical protein